MPVTRPRPSSVTRAMKQQILVLPTSRAATRPLRGAIRIFLILSNRLATSSPSHPWSSSGALGRQAPPGGRVGSQPHDQPVGVAQVDRDEVLLQYLVLALEAGQRRPGRSTVLLGQPDVDAVVEM